MHSSHTAQLFFRTFGLVYGVVAILGFMSGDRPVLGFISNNLADAWLLTGIALVSLLLGFGVKEQHPSLEPEQVQKA